MYFPGPGRTFVADYEQISFSSTAFPEAEPLCLLQPEITVPSLLYFITVSKGQGSKIVVWKILSRVLSYHTRFNERRTKISRETSRIRRFECGQQ
jgi:hypothetical protein